MKVIDPKSDPTHQKIAQVIVNLTTSYGFGALCIIIVLHVHVINECFHNVPVMCPMSVIMAQGVCIVVSFYITQDNFFSPLTVWNFYCCSV